MIAKLPEVQDESILAPCDSVRVIPLYVLFGGCVLNVSTILRPTAYISVPTNSGWHGSYFSNKCRLDNHIIGPIPISFVCLSTTRCRYKIFISK